MSIVITTTDKDFNKRMENKDLIRYGVSEIVKYGNRTKSVKYMKMITVLKLRFFGRMTYKAIGESLPEYGFSEITTERVRQVIAKAIAIIQVGFWREEKKHELRKNEKP